MGIEAAFLEMMPSTVTVYPKSSTDAYGKLSFSATGVATRCRIQPRTDVVVTEDLREIVAKGTIIFYGTPTITTESKIVLPDGTDPLILSVAVHNDESGLHHTTVTYA